MTTTKAAPSFLYYAMIDGTSAVDSVAFGKDLDAKGGSTNWRNLLDLLDPDPADATRLVDPSHDFLPIYRLKRQGALAAGDPKGIAVMCPGGLNGMGFDEMWQNYNGGKPIAFPDLISADKRLLGRHAAAERAAGFISRFMINPVVEIDGAKKHIASDAATTKGTLFRANLLYVSSHGWLGGFSRGDALQVHPGAQPSPVVGLMDEPQREYMPIAAYFVAGKFDLGGAAFAGPEWIILAQCSTLCSTTWAAWARVMARSHPQVRGILGYEEASPAATASIPIANSFFTNLKAKMPIYDAWKAANKGQNWAALVHKDAMGDTLAGWSTKPALSGVALADYLGSASKAPKQVAIDDPPPPFAVRVLHQCNGFPQREVRPDALDSPYAALWGQDQTTVEITPPPGGDITQVTVQWIHIRDTFKQFDLAKIFSGFAASAPDATLTRKPPTVLIADFAKPQTAKVSLKFTAHPTALLKASGLEGHHSYLWPRIHVTGSTMAKTRLDLKMRGLAYYYT